MKIFLQSHWFTFWMSLKSSSLTSIDEILSLRPPKLKLSTMETSTVSCPSGMTVTLDKAKNLRRGFAKSSRMTTRSSMSPRLPPSSTTSSRGALKTPLLNRCSAWCTPKRRRRKGRSSGLTCAKSLPMRTVGKEQMIWTGGGYTRISKIPFRWCPCSKTRGLEGLVWNLCLSLNSLFHVWQILMNYSKYTF